MMTIVNMSVVIIVVLLTMRAMVEGWQRRCCCRRALHRGDSRTSDRITKMMVQLKSCSSFVASVAVLLAADVVTEAEQQ